MSLQLYIFIKHVFVVSYFGLTKLKTVFVLKDAKLKSSQNRAKADAVTSV